MAHRVNRSAISGRFVSKASAARWPTKTISEAVGSGTSNHRSVTRSAETGRFVHKRKGGDDPHGTVTQRV